MSQLSNQLPGVGTAVTAPYRRVFARLNPADLLPGGVVIDGAKSRDLGNTIRTDELRPGVVLGKLTASGKFAPSIIGVLAADHDTSVHTTTLTLTEAQVAEIQRRVGESGQITLIGPEADGTDINVETVTFSAVATATTLTITQTTHDFVDGSIIAPADGSQWPRTLVPDGYHTRVTDANDSDIDVPLPRVPIGGVVDSDLIIDAPTEAATLAWLESRLRSNGNFVFTDTY